MKLTPKQVGAIGAAVVAITIGLFFGPRDGRDGGQPSQVNAQRSGGERVGFRDQTRQGQRRSGRRERNVAGEFDYYSLVLSWSPTYCATRKSNRRDRQCDFASGRGYAFVLHGLWPQYTRGYPESCWTREKPFVQRRTIDNMLDIMPSPGLVIHEYRKHGTCSGLNPERYYALSRRLYSAIKIPKRYIRPVKQQTVSPDALKREFIAVNPGLRADMFAVSCRGSGNRLREMRFCFSRDGKLRACGRNESKGRLCSAARMFVPPVRISPGRG